MGADLMDWPALGKWARAYRVHLVLGYVAFCCWALVLL